MEVTTILHTITYLFLNLYELKEKVFFFIFHFHNRISFNKVILLAAKVHFYFVITKQNSQIINLPLEIMIFPPSTAHKQGGITPHKQSPIRRQAIAILLRQKNHRQPLVGESFADDTKTLAEL